jgi:hypothetical protein
MFGGRVRHIHEIIARGMAEDGGFYGRHERPLEAPSVAEQFLSFCFAQTEIAERLPPGLLDELSDGPVLTFGCASGRDRMPRHRFTLLSPNEHLLLRAIR